MPAKRGKPSTVLKQGTMLQSHELAEALPLIEGEEFAELVASIKAHGQRETIVLLHGKILDGRNRYRACLQAGVEPRTENFRGVDPVAFVIDKNLNRRHLTSGQKAMAVVKYATLSNGQHPSKAAAGMPVARQKEIAAMAGVNKETISDARTIKAHGTPEEVQAVANGAAAISTVANTVRARRNGDDTTAKEVSARAFIAVPAGETLTNVVRRALLLQQDRGLTTDDAAKHARIGTHTYARIRDVILLSERDDLKPAEVTKVKQALTAIDETQQIARPYELVKPIVRRVFGARLNRIKGPKIRDGKFENAITFLANTCESAVGIAIPPLNHARAAAAVEQLKAAVKSLHKLETRIKETFNGR